MSYLKLCQIVSQGNPDSSGHPTSIFYQENCNGEVLVNTSPAFPITYQCEVINWDSQDSFNVHGPIITFESVPVTINNAPITGTIRQAIFAQLQATYPSLVI